MQPSARGAQETIEGSDRLKHGGLWDICSRRRGSKGLSYTEVHLHNVWLLTCIKQGQHPRVVVHETCPIGSIKGFMCTN